MSIFGPPAEPGVYCVFVHNLLTGKRRVLYIGSSHNIKKRVLNNAHPYMKAFNSFKYPEMVATKTKVCEDYLELERRLIQRLKPEYNIQNKK
jgi:excinuclease UvrABC nuclease subunit